MSKVIELPNLSHTQGTLWRHALPDKGRKMVADGLHPSLVVPIFAQNIVGRDVDKLLWQAFVDVAKTYDAASAPQFLDRIVDVTYGVGRSWEDFYRAVSYSPVKISYGDYAVSRVVLSAPVAELNRQANLGFHNACGIVGPLIALSTWWLCESADVPDRLGHVRRKDVIQGSIWDAFQVAADAAGVLAILLGSNT